MSYESKEWPFISVIVPCYNEAHNIKSLIDHLMNKIDYPNFELIIVVDEGSTDNTLEIAMEETKKYNNVRKIKIIKNKKNAGVGPALNEGLKVAEGKYIAYLSADDRPTNNWLKQVLYLEKAPKNVAAITFLAIKNFYLDTKFKLKNFKSSIDELNSGFIIRKDILVSMGGWPNRRFGEDSVLTRKLKKAGYKILTSNEVTILGKPRPGGFIGHLKRNFQYAYQLGLENVANFYEDGLLRTYILFYVIYPLIFASIIIFYLLNINSYLLLIYLFIIMSLLVNPIHIIQRVKLYSYPKNFILRVLIFSVIHFCEKIIYMLGLWKGLLGRLKNLKNKKND
jgi:glycosyltransferase involved in cell wall biosynthesis